MGERENCCSNLKSQAKIISINLFSSHKCSLLSLSSFLTKCTPGKLNKAKWLFVIYIFLCCFYLAFDKVNPVQADQSECSHARSEVKGCCLPMPVFFTFSLKLSANAGLLHFFIKIVCQCRPSSLFHQNFKIQHNPSSPESVKYGRRTWSLDNVQRCNVRVGTKTSHAMMRCFRHRQRS